MVSDLLERNEYIRQCAYLLKVSEEALNATVNKTIRDQRQKATETTPPPPPPLDEELPSPSQEQSSKPAEQLPPAPAAERHLIQLLLNYGNEIIPQVFKDEQGQEQMASYSVADIVISDLQANVLGFSHPLCQSIYEQCAQMLQTEGSINPQHFVSNADPQLSSFTVALMMDTYSLSQSWKNKNVHVPKLEDGLLQDITESLTTFKRLFFQQRIAHSREQLHNATPDEEIQLLEQIMHDTASLSKVVNPGQDRDRDNFTILPHYSNL